MRRDTGMIHATITSRVRPRAPRGRRSHGAGSLARMFVLELTYTAPVSAVDEHLAAHVAWLDGLYEAGTVLASGRKNPRDGGVLIAVAEDRARIEEITASDPFTRAGVCEYRVTEFHATKTAPALASYREEPPA
ncbi:hypothetical protein SALBM135S_02848 [Streptomyces alboniger]